MKIFKTLLIALLLAPVSVFATIVGDANTPGNGSEALPYLVNLGVNTQTIIAGIDEPIDNTWNVEILEEGTLNIVFASQTIDVLNVAIPNFSVSHQGNASDSGIFSLGLLPGTYEFKVSGNASSGFATDDTGPVGIGGIYSVTTDFQPGVVVPVPAAVWFMGTAMLGLLTVGRSRKA